MITVAHTGWRDGLDIIPDHMREGVKAYIEYGHIQGSFLMALLRNNLVETIVRADMVNRGALANWVDFLLGYAPAGCWGSREKVDLWMNAGGLRGLIAKQEEGLTGRTTLPTSETEED